MVTPPISPRPAKPPTNEGRERQKGRDAAFEGSPPSSHLVYPNQLVAAEELATRIKDRLVTLQKGKGGEGFRKIWGVILTPSSLSLREQTQTRLAEFQKSVEPLNLTVTCTSIVKSKDFSKLCTELLRGVKDEPDTLFVVVHDEAHYGIAVDSVLDKELLQELVLVGKKHQNVVYLAVSATPWVLLDKHTFDRRERNLVEYKPPKEYSGLAKLVDSSHWMVDDTVTSEDELIKQYVAAFNAGTRDDSSPTFTERAVRSLLSTETSPKRSLVVIRIPVLRGKGTAEERANAILKGLRDVCAPHRITLLNGAMNDNKAWRAASAAMVAKDKVILVLAKRFHTGDTFPSHFSFLDERLCLCSDSTSENLVKAHQEIGRAYGYGRRPYVGVSSTTDAVIRSIPVSADEVLNGETTGTTPHRYMIARQQSARDGKGSYFVPAHRCLYSRTWDEENSWFLDSRFVLCAQPQSGKTGVVLWTLKLLTEFVRQPPVTPSKPDVQEQHEEPQPPRGRDMPPTDASRERARADEKPPESREPEGRSAPAPAAPPTRDTPRGRHATNEVLRAQLACLGLKPLKQWVAANQVDVKTNVGGPKRRTLKDFVNDIMEFLDRNPNHFVSPPQH